MDGMESIAKYFETSKKKEFSDSYKTLGDPKNVKNHVCFKYDC